LNRATFGWPYHYQGFAMKIKIEKSVTVITPTIGQTVLRECVESVAKQTYKNLHHLLVVDGDVYWQKVMSNASAHYRPGESNIKIATAPYNTGGVAPGYYGHRIYAAYPHLVNTDYVVFLDEDNWIEPNHVQSLVDTIEKNGYQWAHSLRNIYTRDGDFLDLDCCESTGRWPVYWSLSQPRPQQEHLVDTSSYCFRTDYLVGVCNHWHSGWGGDRRFYRIITEALGHTNFGTTGLHTLNYRLDDAPELKYGSIDFFKKGNEAVKDYYGEYPWLK